MKTLFEPTTFAKSHITDVIDVTPVAAEHEPSSLSLVKRELTPLQTVEFPVVPASCTKVCVLAPRVTDDQISEIGANAANALKGVSSQLLGQVRASDTGDFGKGLSDLVGLAKGLSPDQLKDQGLLGKVRGMFFSAKERLVSQYATVEKQIDSLTLELNKKVGLHKKRVGDLEALYTSNFEYHQELDAGVTTCQQVLIALQADYQKENLKVIGDSFGAQVLQDYQRLIARVEKRIDDLGRAKMLSKQVAPQIRLMQEDTRALIGKFGDVQSVTLPAWKNTFSLYILQLEQKKSVELLTKIDDATDAALRQSADLLRENSASIATSRNRSVVSIDTLSHIQAQLTGAIEDVKRIDDEGRARRIAEAPKLQAMEAELIKAFAPGQR